MWESNQWESAPGVALWYGEVIFVLDGQTDYHYGYSSSDEPDNPDKYLMPKGAELLGWAVRATPRNEKPILTAWGYTRDYGEWEEWEEE